MTCPKCGCEMEYNYECITVGVVFYKCPNCGHKDSN